jgi:hypothetical protein
METAPTPGEVGVQNMEQEVDGGNLPEDIVGIAIATLEAEVINGAGADVMNLAIGEMEVDVVSQVTEIAQAAIGEVVAEKDAVAAIPINSWEEDNQDVMIIISPEEAAEADAVKVPAWEEAAQVLLQAGAAGAATIGNSFSKTSIK